jgi:hypothetical protein
MCSFTLKKFSNIITSMPVMKATTGTGSKPATARGTPFAS